MIPGLTARTFVPWKYTSRYILVLLAAVPRGSFPLEHVQQLRNFIQLCLSKKLTHAGDARVAKGRELGSLLIRPIDHGAELEDLENSAVLPDSRLAVEDRPA